MAEFSPKKRAVIEQLHLRGFKQSDIAEQLNISQSGVSRTLKRIANADYDGDLMSKEGLADQGK